MAHEKIAIIGAGSWGTALTKPLADKDFAIYLWDHFAEHIEKLREAGENPDFLPGYKFRENIRPVSDLEEAVRGSLVVVMAIPSHFFRGVFRRVIPFLAEGAHVVSVAKGIENETLRTMSQVMAEELAVTDAKPVHVAVLSGPSFAREVSMGLPTAVTIASESAEAARYLQEAFSTDVFRVYTSSDVIGLELGGSLKNIVAIAAGISDGLGYGTNTRAALITRGLAEISRLGVKMGAEPLTFSGLAGLGDLVLTCTGDLSRNRTVGLGLGHGKRLTAILEEMKMVAEGVKTTRSAWDLARKEGVEMPILEQVYQVLYHDKPCNAAVQDLMTRSVKEELD